jgi:hypothetical protein
MGDGTPHAMGRKSGTYVIGLSLNIFNVPIEIKTLTGSLNGSDEG